MDLEFGCCLVAMQVSSVKDRHNKKGEINTKEQNKTSVLAIDHADKTKIDVMILLFQKMIQMLSERDYHLEDQTQ